MAEPLFKNSASVHFWLVLYYICTLSLPHHWLRKSELFV